MDTGTLRGVLQGVDGCQKLRPIVCSVAEKPSGLRKSAIGVAGEERPSAGAGVYPARAIGVGNVGLFRQGGWGWMFHVGVQYLLSEEAGLLLLL